MINEINKVFEADILAKNRKQDNVFARIAYANIMRNSGKSFQQIGKEINKGHATIMYYCEQHDQLYRFNFDYKYRYDLIQIGVIEVIKKIDRIYKTKKVLRTSDGVIFSSVTECIKLNKFHSVQMQKYLNENIQFKRL